MGDCIISVQVRLLFFKTKEIAEKVVTKIMQEVLMLSNGRYCLYFFPLTLFFCKYKFTF